ncbi:MAG: flagellar biosynthesis/type III secretory pathway M-ring protein FliF/YscJ, partial [bacterium]
MVGQVLLLKIIRKVLLSTVLGSIVLMSHLSIPQDTFAQKIENLAFKILERKAVDYENALTKNIESSLKRYVSKDRFHITVRIYWNPAKLKELKFKNKPLKRKKGKLPGFPIFVREEEKSLDYYMGTGSVMRLLVTVLLDKNLPEKYKNFIYKLVPAQARFVPERGDAIKVIPVEFPEAKKLKGKKDGGVQKEIPLGTDEATAAILEAIEKGRKKLLGDQPTIIHPVIQNYISQYEKHITKRLEKILKEYLDKKKFILNVKFFWNPGQITKLRLLVMRTDPQGKVKLPGLKMFLEEKNALYEAISNSTTLLRLEVTVLLDKNVPKSVDSFLNKAVPLSFKFIPARGDKLTIARANFPKGFEKLG